MSQDSVSASDFKPFVVRTDNIAKELVSTASNYGIKASALDFNLLEVQTFVSKEGEADTEDEISSDELESLNDKALLSDEKVRIRQVYEIEIIHASKESPFSGLSISIGANPSMSRLFASIKPGSVVSYYDGIETDLKRFINKRKLRANMLIGFWDENIEEEISKFVAKVQVKETFKVEEKISFEVGECLEPVPTINDKLILHFEDEDKTNSVDKVDHSKRGFVQGVVEGELLIEYIKPIKGEPGRNCRGEYIEAVEPTITETPAFSVSDKFDVIESEQSTQYRAKSSGYIIFENNTYDIKVEMEVSEISFKTTGSIEAGVDTDVSINVKEADAFKDAIGAGMEVEVNEINVDGNVGNNAKIKARKAQIQGQTHQSSYVEADEVEINIHKGRVKGLHVKVTRLEQGIIEAESVEVAQATGGKIVAKEVLIETLSSHVDIVASDKIEIQNCKGEENTFTISPVLYDEDKDALSDKDEELSNQKRKIRTIKEELESKQKILDDNASSIIDLKKRLAHYKESGTKMPGSFVLKFKEFQDLQKHLLSLKKELKQNEEMLSLLAAGTQSLQEDILKSKIINHDTYKGHNEIRFKILDPEQELYHVPTGGTQEKCFMLKYDEDSDSYAIEGSDTI